MGLLNWLLHVGTGVAGAAREEALRVPCHECGETTLHREGLYKDSTTATFVKFMPHVGLIHIASEVKSQFDGEFTYTCTRCGSHRKLTREVCSELDYTKIARKSALEVGMTIGEDVVSSIVNPFNKE